MPGAGGAVFDGSIVCVVLVLHSVLFRVQHVAVRAGPDAAATGEAASVPGIAGGSAELGGLGAVPPRVGHAWGAAPAEHQLGLNNGGGLVRGVRAGHDRAPLVAWVWRMRSVVSAATSRSQFG
jgi:hypothetical protein